MSCIRISDVEQVHTQWGEMPGGRANASTAQPPSHPPAARPLVFTTMGAPHCAMKALAAAGSVNASYCAVGILYLRHRPFINALEPSSCAAAAVGPNAVMPAAASASTKPSTSGCSGPTSTKSTRFSRQKAMTWGRGGGRGGAV